MTSYGLVTQVRDDIRGNRDFLIIFFFRNPFFYRHEALFYIESCATCHERNERVQQQKIQNNEAPLYIGFCVICHSRDERVQQ